MKVECEYCGRDDVTLYAFHADVWCADCISRSGLPINGSIADAPIGRPAMPEYERPFVWQTMDGAVLGGRVQP